MHRSVIHSIAAVLCAACTAGVLAQTPGASPVVENRLAHWSLLLDLVTGELDKRQTDLSIIEALRPQIEKLQREAEDASVAAALDAEAVHQLLETLGPPPADGEAPESAEIAAERAALEEHRTEREGYLKQTELISTRAKQVMARIAEARRAHSTRRLLERGPSPLSWAVLGKVGPYAFHVVQHLKNALIEQWTLAPAVTHWTDWQPLVLIALLLSILFVLPARRWMLKRYIRDRALGPSSLPYRILASVLVGIARGVLPALVAVVPLGFLLSIPDERGIAADILVATFGALAGIVLAGGLARAALAPYSPDGWRPAPLTGESARELYRRIYALVWLVGGLFFIDYLATRHLEAPRELAAFYRLLADAAVAGCVLLLLPGRLWHRRDPEGATTAAPGSAPTVPGPRRIGRILRLAAATAALSIPILSLAGFEPLASYLASSLVESVALLALAVIAHGIARDTVVVALARRDDSAMLRFWLVVAIDTLIALVLAVALLASWGLAWIDIKALLTAAVDGIRIGSFRLSVTDLLLALIVFTALLAATRWLQRLLENRVFPQTRLDAGMRNSLKSTIGYLGLIVAVAVAISTAGLDLSNIAIIAGALSIGIGFGLQNIVNNFVSGLILLAERPIKIGDWIRVGEHEGYVQRINVRATEVRTFQRSSVIIPNSELLSSALINWTHKDAMARIEIPVGASYAADVDLVRSTLLEIATAHPEVLQEPPPYVLFMAFGDSSLDFELRCFTAEADLKYSIATEMRFEIVRRFRERSIEIPFPQRDVHLRGFDAIAGGPRGADPPPEASR